MLKRKTAVVGVTGNIWRRIVFGPGRSKDFKFLNNQQIFSIEAPHHGDHGVRDLFVAVKRQRGGRLKQSHVVGLLRVPAMRIKRSQWWWFWWRQWGRQWWHAYERLQKFDVDDILLEISVWSPEVLDSSRLQLQRALNLWSKWKQLVAIWSKSKRYRKSSWEFFYYETWEMFSRGSFQVWESLSSSISSSWTWKGILSCSFFSLFLTQNCSLANNLIETRDSKNLQVD